MNKKQLMAYLAELYACLEREAVSFEDWTVVELREGIRDTKERLRSLDIEVPKFGEQTMRWFGMERL
jgi:hypothetical protein